MLSLQSVGMVAKAGQLSDRGSIPGTDIKYLIFDRACRGPLGLTSQRCALAAFSGKGGWPGCKSCIAV